MPQSIQMQPNNAPTTSNMSAFHVREKETILLLIPNWDSLSVTGKYLQSKAAFYTLVISYYSRH